MNFVHIDKTIKNIKFEIANKPIGAGQWDFLSNLPGAKRALLKKMDKGPDTAFIFLSFRCNEKCKNCVIKNIKKKEYDYRYDSVIDVLKYLKKINTSYIIYDGNSLEHRRFIDILKKTYELGFQVSINIERQITAKELKLFKKYGVQKIQMKLYGLDNIHKNYQNNYQTVINNLKICKENNLYTSLIFSITNDNYFQIDKYIDFCERNNVGQFAFIRLPICPFYNPKNWSFLNGRAFLALSRKIINYRKTSKVHITSNEAMWKGCGAAAVSCAMLPGNLISPCVYIRHFTKLQYADQIKNEWHSPLYKNIRFSLKLKGKCGKCRYNFYCKGCRAVAELIKHDIYGEDPGCWI